MEVLQQRRKAGTYGKRRRNLQLDSIFDDEIINRSQIRVSSPPRQEVLKASLSKRYTPNETESRGHQTASSAPGHHTRFVSPAATDHRQDFSDSSSSRSSEQNESANSSILDILDSDQEACTQQLQPAETKKRKITSLRQFPRPDNKSRIWKQDQVAVSRQNKSPRPHQNKESIRKADLPSSQQPARPTKKQTKAQNVSGSSTTGQDKESASCGLSSSASATSLRKIRGTELEDHPSCSDQDDAALQQTPLKTPKARRVSQHNKQFSEPVASPSQLGLTSLQLTPETKYHLTSLSPQSSSVTPRRARGRLTDRLDAPEKDPSSPSGLTRSNDGSLDKSGGKTTVTRRLVPRSRDLENSSFIDVPRLPKTSRAINDRSRLTYAKERSYLSDMMNEVDSLKSLQRSESTASVPAVPPNLLNLESAVPQERDDSDQFSAANAVRSIHELRQAGINNRFERDLETLFEDIEPQSNPSKALRIQALLRLIEKLNQSSFARQFIEVGMTRRLAGCAQVHLDTISAVLLIHALSRLLLLNHMSVQHVLAAFHAVAHLSPSLLEHNEIFNKFVTGRNQNLAKALSRDLVAFAQATEIGPSPGIMPWTPQQVALFALEHSARSIRMLKAVPPDLPATFLNQVLTFLSTVCDKHVSSQSQRHTAAAALSILEFSAASRVVGEPEEDRKIALDYALLSDVITRLMINSTVDDADLRGLALRLVVTLTNNEPQTCAELARKDLIPTVFVVVTRDLPLLSVSADRGDEFDNIKLDSVIMALGCLLNLADCSKQARRRMYTPSSNSSNNVQWLVSVFNERAGKAAEATTLAQSQVLVAFGYMSMLLCTLCLDDDVYGYVANSIHGNNVAALCVEAEEFLDKLEMVARLNPDDAATSTFNERFRSILVSLSTRTPLRTI